MLYLAVHALSNRLDKLANIFRSVFAVFLNNFNNSTSHDNAVSVLGHFLCLLGQPSLPRLRKRLSAAFMSMMKRKSTRPMEKSA